MAETRKFRMVLVPLVSALHFAILFFMGGLFPMANDSPNVAEEALVPEKMRATEPVAVNASAASMP